MLCNLANIKMLTKDFLVVKLNFIWQQTIKVQTSSYPTKAKFNNNSLLFLQNIFPLKEFCHFALVFPLTESNTTSSPGSPSQRFNIICSWLHFWHHFDIISSIIRSRLHFWHHWFNIWSTELVMVNYACGFNQSEIWEIFWMNNNNLYHSLFYLPFLPLIWKITCFTVKQSYSHYSAVHKTFDKRFLKFIWNSRFFSMNLAISLRSWQSNHELRNEVVNYTLNFVGKLWSSSRVKFASFGVVGLVIQLQIIEFKPSENIIFSAKQAYFMIFFWNDYYFIYRGDCIKDGWHN